MRAAVAWLISVGCAASPRALPPTLADDFAARHAAVYDAFAIGPEPDALHDHLARSFVGEALTEAYVEHYRTLVELARRDVGVRVLGVEHEDLVVAPLGDGARASLTWYVRSTVRHQRHTHARIARYRGFFDLALTGDGPRISRAVLQDLQRVRSGLGAGDVFEAGGDATGRGFMDPLELLEAGALDGEAP